MSSSSSTSELHSADAEPSYSGGNLSLSWERGNETARSQQVNKALENRGIAAAFSSSDDDGYGEDDSEMQGESEECSSEWEAPRKKVKVAKKQRRSKTGKAVVKPGLLSILPLELFTEIFVHSAPEDLLALSRTCTTFHSLLSSRASSAAIWQAARRAVGLPDLTAGKITEQQYVQLVFGIHCQSCGKANIPHADYDIRKRLCKACRKSNWVKLYFDVEDLHPELHPRVVQICLYTYHSASSGSTNKGTNKHRYAFLGDLEVLSEKLFELGAAAEEDEHEVLMRELLDSGALGAATQQVVSTRTRQSHPPARYGESTMDGSAPSSALTSGGYEPTALDLYLQERRDFGQAVRHDAKQIRKAVVVLEREKAKEKERKKLEDDGLAQKRREAIETKVLALEDYWRADFTGAWLTSKIINSPVPLTDEEWDNTVKSKVLKLLEGIKAKQAKLEVVRKQEERQRSVRRRYRKLLRSQLTEQASHSLPLFANFLQLDSVKPLWEPEDADAEGDDEWAEHLDAILEELDDYRISVRLEAVQTILRATTEMSEEELNGDADEFGAENGYDDQWLARPISFLVCNLPGCRIKSRKTSDGRKFPSRPTFFGSLPDLLAHQHAKHADLTFTEKQHRQRQEQGMVGHFHLPPLVVSALSSVIALTGVDDAAATLADVDGVTRDGEPGQALWDACLLHKNTGGNKKYHASWRSLIDECIKQSEIAIKSKRVLEVPEIILLEKERDSRKEAEDMEVNNE